MNPYLSTLAIARLPTHGRTVIGFIDIAQKQEQMDALKPVTVSIARVLLKYGQQAIDGAIAGAKQPWYKPDLPGMTARDNVAGHLHWHAVMLSSAPNPMMPYNPGNDLKKWVMQAYIEANAVEEGAAYIDKAWADMWQEIADELAKIPQAIRDAAGKAVENITGVPVWAWAVGGALVVGALGFLTYKIATGPVGGAVASAYLGRR